MTAERDALIEFLQTSLDEGDPVGRSPAGLVSWLAAHGLVEADVEASEEDVTRARRLRAALSSVLRTPEDAELDPRTAAAIAAVTSRAPFELELTGDGRLSPRPVGASVDAALAELVAILYRTQITGERSRLKACKQCGWAFYDESKNRSRVWCNMALCGSQEKSRAYRLRRKAGAPSS